MSHRLESTYISLTVIKYITAANVRFQSAPNSVSFLQTSNRALYRSMSPFASVFVLKTHLLCATCAFLGGTTICQTSFALQGIQFFGHGYASFITMLTLHRLSIVPCILPDDCIHDVAIFHRGVILDLHKLACACRSCTMTLSGPCNLRPLRTFFVRFSSFQCSSSSVRFLLRGSS